MTKRHCANGTACAAYPTFGEPAKLSRYNPEDVCGECLLASRVAQAARSAAAGGGHGFSRRRVLTRRAEEEPLFGRR